MQEKIIVEKTRFNVETTLIDGHFPLFINYTESAEYQEMLSVGNFYEASAEEVALMQQNQMCVVNGILQVYQPPIESIKKALDAAKMRKRIQLIKDYNNIAGQFVVRIDFEGKTNYINLQTRQNAIMGLNEALAKIQNDVAMNTIVDPLIPEEYRGIDRMYYIYVTEFTQSDLVVSNTTKFNTIDTIKFKQEYRNELINLFTLFIEQCNPAYTGEYSYYTQYMNHRRVAEDTLLALETIEEIDAFTYQFTPYEVTIPEAYILNVVYNDVE